ncbi:hypothetical protein DPMN_004311 [Dreissena polymorpha]|uniref:Uncharacterized protein n=1 Tax=Dreissena polymorpha TaxID=45954 RepID=A0A9D4RVT3_DREPO|nr:hypothetical protein DPMN_004311 [Dreissena polymorpha]
MDSTQTIPQAPPQYPPTKFLYVFPLFYAPVAVELSVSLYDLPKTLTLAITFAIASNVTATVFTSFELSRGINGTNVLTKFHEDRTINVASGEFTRQNVYYAQRTTDKRRSQKLTMSTLCSGELKGKGETCNNIRGRNVDWGAQTGRYVTLKKVTSGHEQDVEEAVSPTLDPRDPVSYRGIALASAIYKVYSQSAIKTIGGVPYDVYTKLYDSVVWPVIAYGAANRAMRSSPFHVRKLASTALREGGCGGCGCGGHL